MNEYTIPELLAPAGSMEHVHTALTYGADAVYLGGADLNLRAQCQGFQWNEFKNALNIVHRHGKKCYFCLNSFPEEGQLPQVRHYLFRLKEYPPDALIVADPGLINLAQTLVPEIPLHLSTQANTTNSSSVHFWQHHGIKRINLARELNCRSIRHIRENVPDLELEVFVHGAQCMAISGRCYLSSYLNQRSANQGLCTHPCRFQYRVRSLILEESQRPGQPVWEITEDTQYANLLASEDLCLIKYLMWFVRNKISALKIEGRTKSNSYLAPVLDVYKTALKDIGQKSFRPKEYLRELEKNCSRPLATGFFLPQKRKTVLSPPTKEKTRPVLAKIIDQETPTSWQVSIRHQWSAQRGFHIIVPGLHRPFVRPHEYCLENNHGIKQSVVHPGQTARLRCDHPQLKTSFFLRSSNYS